jgi:hypothetical protein
MLNCTAGDIRKPHDDRAVLVGVGRKGRKPRTAKRTEIQRVAIHYPAKSMIRCLEAVVEVADDG